MQIDLPLPPSRLPALLGEKCAVFTAQITLRIDPLEVVQAGDVVMIHIIIETVGFLICSTVLCRVTAAVLEVLLSSLAEFSAAKHHVLYTLWSRVDASLFLMHAAAAISIIVLEMADIDRVDFLGF